MNQKRTYGGKPSISRKKNHRKRGASGKKGRRRWIIATTLGMMVLILVGLLFSVLHARVLEIRQKRARQAVLKVLTQTSTTAEEQVRFAVAISQAAISKGLNPAVVAAIIVVESSGNPLTVSGTGELGLMQVNVRVHRKEFDFQSRNLLNPEENIEVGTYILKTMLNRHGEDKAIAAYNGLEPEKSAYAGRVKAVLEKAGIPEQESTVAYSAPVPPP
jgi:soluble lytic murein transglycosylase-like protein